MSLLAHWEFGAVVLFALLFLGMPISFALALLGTVGTAAIVGWGPSLSLLGQTFFDNFRHKVA